MFNNSAWLAQIKEAVLDPDRDIVDPHHHLWPQSEHGLQLGGIAGRYNRRSPRVANRVHGVWRCIPQRGS